MGNSCIGGDAQAQPEPSITRLPKSNMEDLPNANQADQNAKDSDSYLVTIETDRVAAKKPKLTHNLSSPPIIANGSTEKNSKNPKNAEDLPGSGMTNQKSAITRRSKQLETKVLKGLHQAQVAEEERQMVCFNTTEFDLVEAFQNIDRDRDGKITIQDMLRELKRVNPLANKQDHQKYQDFLELIMPEYSKATDKTWGFPEFQQFMHDSALLEKTLQQKQ